MQIREIGYVTLRESEGGFICRHTFIAEGFGIKDEAFKTVYITEYNIGKILGGPVILSFKYQGEASEVSIVFTLEISHDSVQGPAEEPLRLAGERLSTCLEELSLDAPSNQIEEREWKQLISFESSTRPTEIISELRKNNNQPTVGGDLACLGGHITRLNDKLRKAGLMFEVRSIEHEKKGMWRQRFKLVRTI